MLFRWHCTGFFPLQCFLESPSDIEKGFYLWNAVSRVLRQHRTGFFRCNVVYSILDNIAQGFYMCNVVSRVIRQHWTRFFPVQCCLEPLGQDCTRCLSVQDVYPLGQHCTRVFHGQCCLEPLKQHCIGFLPMHYWSMVNKQFFLAK